MESTIGLIPFALAHVAQRGRDQTEAPAHVPAPMIVTGSQEPVGV